MKLSHGLYPMDQPFFFGAKLGTVVKYWTFSVANSMQNFKLQKSFKKPRFSIHGSNR
jgi:hypothetical protein